MADVLNIAPHTVDMAQFYWFIKLLQYFKQGNFHNKNIKYTVWHLEEKKILTKVYIYFWMKFILPWK